MAGKCHKVRIIGSNINTPTTETIPMIAWWFLDKKKAFETEQKYKETNKRITEVLLAQEQERSARQEAERKEEQERLARKEAEHRENQERIAREQAELREDQERLAREHSERREAQERLAREEAESREEQERLARNVAEAREIQERIAREQAEQREGQERLARREAEQREKQERLAREQAEYREEQERLARQEAELREEQGRLALERAELNERLAREAERKERYWRELRELGVLPDSKITDADIKYARTVAGYEDGAVNIALIGNRGTGKSSLINSLRGLSHGDREAAEVGDVETTLRRKKYRDSKGFVWYDMPGSGTRNISAWQYYYDNDLYIYDKIVLVHGSALTESDLRVLKLCQYRKQEWVSVRSKADLHIWNYKRRRGMCAADARQFYIDAVRSDTSTYNARNGDSVEDLKLSVKDYIVSDMGVFQLVTGSKPFEDPVQQVIDEAGFLEELGLLPG
ncbi:interferon-inducible GTPase-domain-containing protein [Daldinia vernicosa]|uniref:interferon-inducible GTPase-domain-containing protein n=1 Tax=Daldinia vernicosa TaxID=114800 RepID=UPI00200737F7|nr:interferon-inducible GTPase-domain-containing protein [Daldinia vernicosa]KAI0846458.1 interferon-inducible GTPase-domain-containing protein [Daldinia vernicosa]